MSGDALDRLLALKRRGRHTVVGLMSGTSADGVDAAVVRLDDASGRLEAHLLFYDTRPYARAMRERVLAAASAAAPAIAELDFLLGSSFAEAALHAVQGAGLARAEVDFIGSHGQTICHVPPGKDALGCTMQIGQAAVIAERTGLPVVSDFRARDMALGGQGAPLVPLADHLLFGRAGEARVLLNIGGVANLTASNGRHEDLIAFDTGPGNALLDALVRLASNGAEAYDRNGERAARGRVDERLLADLLAHPFLAQAPPRSADRDTFGAPLARRLLAEHASLPLEDLLATAAAFTAESIARAIRGLPAPFARIDRVIASGGGVQNAALMAALAARLAGVPLEESGLHGVPADAKEAIAFAVLARETLLGRPGNVHVAGPPEERL
ncbi:MAG: anhydro-N-acetylmuramic acid kinase, partial [Planctomycetes bacterium]|nr:anhydro-N-acetylmuramic acid kinase [Planctomycetota bacterium]